MKQLNKFLSSKIHTNKMKYVNQLMGNKDYDFDRKLCLFFLPHACTKLK